MSEPQLLSTLHRKRDEIETRLPLIETRSPSPRDLSAVIATICLFAQGATATVKPWSDLSRLWKRKEIVTVCRDALATEGPSDTCELALQVIRAKGLDEADRVLRKAVAFMIVQALSLAAKRGKIGNAGIAENVRVWSLS